MMRTIAHNRSQPSDSSSAAATMSRKTPSRLWNTRFFPIGKEYHILDGLSSSALVYDESSEPGNDGAAH